MNITARRITAGSAIALAAAALPLAMNASPAQAAGGNFVPASATVTASNLAVRTGPSVGATQISTLYRGATMAPLCSATGTMVAGSSQWYQLDEGGWVSARYTHLQKGSVPTCASYPGMKLLNLDIDTPEQAKAKLARISPSFMSYIAGESANLVQSTKLNKGSCRSHSISVAAWWSSNQAVGDVFGCGGYHAVWTLKGGTWHETASTGPFFASDLKAAGATHAIPGNLGYLVSGPNGNGTLPYTPGR